MQAVIVIVRTQLSTTIPNITAYVSCIDWIFKQREEREQALASNQHTTYKQL